MFNEDQIIKEFKLESLSEEAKRQQVNNIIEILQLRVGNILSEKMTDEQATSFEQLLNDGKDDEAVTWLENNFPDYKKIIADEFNKLKTDADHTTDKWMPGNK